MTRLAMSRALSEGMFNYDFTWRKNSDIIGAFIRCLARARIGKWEMLNYALICFIWSGAMG